MARRSRARPRLTSSPRRSTRCSREADSKRNRARAHGQDDQRLFESRFAKLSQSRFIFADNPSKSLGKRRFGWLPPDPGKAIVRTIRAAKATRTHTDIAFYGIVPAGRFACF